MAQDSTPNAPPSSQAPPSSSDADAIDVVFDDVASVDRLLEITGESWSIDGQVESLKEATKVPTLVEKSVAAHQPRVMMPTPYDLGNEARRPPPLAPTVGKAPRRPPPLPPEANAPAAQPPPLPTAAQPPPLPAAAQPPPLPAKALPPSASMLAAKPAQPPPLPPAALSPPHGSAAGGQAQPPPLPPAAIKAHGPPPLPPEPRRIAQEEASTLPIEGKVRPELPDSRKEANTLPIEGKARPELLEAKPPGKGPAGARTSVVVPPPPPRERSVRLVKIAEPKPSPSPAAPGGSPLPPPVSTALPPPPSAIKPAREERAPRGRPLPEYAQTLVQLLEARVRVLEPADDRVGLARAHVELAIVAESIGDDGRTNAHAEAALAVEPALGIAHNILRRRLHGGAALPLMLEHLDHEIRESATEAITVELLTERARLLSAADHRSAESGWRHVLGRAPAHAAALKGLEATLWAATTSEVHQSAEVFEALDVHLSSLADAYSSQPELAAWLHVERGLLLERRLGRARAARSAFERARELAPSVGPVRSALVRHVAAQGDMAALAMLLEEEATLETDPARAARLDLDAACLCRARLADDPRAIRLLERAARRAPTTTSVDHRVLDELCELYAEAGQWADSVRAREARLQFALEPALVLHELRQIAVIREKLGDIEGAIVSVRRALDMDPEDARVFDTLDRLLGRAERHEERAALWLAEAAATTDAQKRARALAKAAQVSEIQLGRPEDARRHLKAAWVACPGDSDVLDSLARLMSPRLTEAVDGDARKLVEVYAQAAQRARDAGRKVAYLEKVALLWEELLGDAKRAAKTYEEILDAEPQRHGAILGLIRTAGRTGDDRALARALMAEAEVASDGATVLALRARAATALARVDPARAIAVVEDVLTQDHAHGIARALQTRLHEEAGRWELAARSLRARIEDATSVEEKVGLWLELARLSDVRLRAPLDALEALEAARKIDPVHPVPPVEIARVLRASGDDAALRGAIERLADEAITKEERARYLVRAAELDELRLANDASAARLYARALAETPDDLHVAERLARVLARRAAGSPADPSLQAHTVSAPRGDGLIALAELLEARLQIAQTREEQLSLGFDLAALLVDIGEDGARAARLLEAVLEAVPSHVPSLRLLELLARRTGSSTQLAKVLSRQGSAVTDLRARVGALWNLAWLEEWQLPPGSEVLATFSRILELDPTDPGALEATLRCALEAARRGEPHARRMVHMALLSLSSLASEDEPLLALLLRLGLLQEAHANETGEFDLLRSALERFRTALEIDPASVTAATSLARLATKLGDALGALASAISLADLAANPVVRARYLIEAAEILLGPDETLGSRPERSERAAEHLEAALAADPDARVAATSLVAVRAEQKQGERLVEVFWSALGRASEPESVVLLGTEIAKVARDELRELTLAIDAMRRVREAAPDSVPSLLMLAELCIAQRAWPEAVEALEQVVAKGKEPGPRLTALFALSSVYERVLSRPSDAETALRRALEIEPRSARALRALVHRLVAKQSEKLEDGEPPPSKLAIRLEVSGLLERLAEVEPDFGVKSEIFLQLADIRASVKDARAAELALVEALAHAPTSARAEERFERFHRGGEAFDAVAYARSLTALIGRGNALGTGDARWHARLGHVNVTDLARLRDGVTQIQLALKLDPELHESRVELASAHARLGAHEEAVSTIFAMITPSSKPLVSVKDPSAALELLERSLGADRRPEEAIVVSELRAIMGDLDEGRHGWLRARRLGPFDSHHVPLERATLISHVVPDEGRHALLDVAAAIFGLEARMLRSDLTELGLTPKDRIGKRSGHPTRALLDRLVKALGLGDVELVVSAAVTRVRVLAQDHPWVVVPQSLLELTEPTQLAAIGRALGRITLSVPWLEELPPPHIEAFLIACARQVAPAYGRDDMDALSQKLVLQYEPTVAKELSRKQRQALEKLVPTLTLPRSRPVPIDGLIAGLARAELRVAYLMTGDLLATIDELRSLDPRFLAATETPGRGAIAAVLDHPYAGDVVRFALGTEATALRRRVGATWTG